MPNYRYNGHPSTLLTLRDAVDLGYGGYSTLRKHIAEGRLPARRQGNRWRVHKEDLDALLVDGSTDQIDAAVQRLVASSPSLSPGQTRQLRDLLGGAA